MDDQQFTQIVSDHGDFAYNVAYRMMGNVADAEEVVQDAFVSAYRSRDRFRGDAQVTTWLYRIVMNAALMRLRKRSRKYEVTMDPADLYRHQDSRAWADAPDKAALNGELKEQLQAAIGALPEDLQSAVVLRDVQGLSNGEAAKVLKLSVSALKARLHRGRVMLRNTLAEYVSRTR